MRRIARLALLASALAALVACGPVCGFGASLSLSNARVDPTFSCPYPANNLPYDIHASIDAKNTSGIISLQLRSIEETWMNIATHGNWTGTKGAYGTVSITKFSPRSINAGGSATIRFVLSFECTNSGAGAETYGDFSFKFVVKTNGGDYAISPNHHRLTFGG